MQAAVVNGGQESLIAKRSATEFEEDENVSKLMSCVSLGELLKEIREMAQRNENLILVTLNIKGSGERLAVPATRILAEVMLIWQHLQKQLGVFQYSKKMVDVIVDATVRGYAPTFDEVLPPLGGDSSKLRRHIKELIRNTGRNLFKIVENEIRLTSLQKIVDFDQTVNFTLPDEQMRSLRRRTTIQ